METEIKMIKEATEIGDALVSVVTKLNKDLLVSRATYLSLDRV